MARYDVTSGVTKSDVVLNRNDSMYVYSGGTATGTTVNAIGRLYVSSGGSATDTTVNYGQAEIKPGASADVVTVSRQGWFIVSSGGTATNVTENGGAVIVNDGATVTFVPNAFSEILVERDGPCTVHSGTTATDIIINDLGYFYVYDHGSANSVTVNSGGEICVSSGGSMNSATVNSAGLMYVSSGGTADVVTVNPGGLMFVSSGGTATRILENGGYVEVDPDATVTFVPSVLSGFDVGNTTIHSGTTGIDLTFGDGGDLTVFSGGIVKNITAGKGDWLNVSGGGKVTGKMAFDAGAHVSAFDGGILDFDLGETLADTDALATDLTCVKGDPRYTITVEGTEASGNYRLAGIATGFNRTVTVVTASGDELGTLTVGGGALSTAYADYTLNLTGNALSLDVVSKAVDDTKPVVANVAADITAPTAGSVTVTAEFSDNVKLKSSLYRIGDGAWQDYAGGVIVTENATVSFKAVDTYGNESDVVSIAINNIDRVAPTITDFTLNPADHTSSVTLTAVFADNVALASRQYRIGEGGDWRDYTTGVTLTENTTVHFRATDTAGNETSASCEVKNIILTGDLTSSASLTDGMLASSVNIDDVRLTVLSGGTANSTTLTDEGGLIISNGGLASNTTLNGSYTVFYVMPGGTAINTAVNAGNFHVSSGTAINTTVNYAFDVYSGGMASNTTVNSNGIMDVSGGTAIDTTVNPHGYLYVSSGGTATNTRVESEGCLAVFSGGTAANVDVEGGVLHVRPGGKVTGKLRIRNEVVSAYYDGAILDFDLTQTAPGADALVDDLSRALPQKFTYTLTVSDTQVDGTYNLAERAAGFDKTITVVNTLGEALGTITVAEGTKTVGNRKYTLSLDEAELSVTVAVIPDLTGDLKREANLSSGMIASSTNVLSGGELTVLKGGFASMTTVKSRGIMYVTSGGNADGVTADFSCNLYVSSGGTATQIKENGGFVNVNSDASATFIPNSFSGYTYSSYRDYATLHSGTTGTSLTATGSGNIIVNGGYTEDTTLETKGNLRVFSGGTASSNYIDSGGILHVSDGGRAINNLVFSGGMMYVSNGGTGIYTMVYSGGSMCVSGGGSADLVIVDGGGLEVVGTATMVDWDPCNGYLRIGSGASVTFRYEHSGVYFGSWNKLLSSAAVMDSKTLAFHNTYGDLIMYVMSGGTANATTVNEGGRMYVWSSGTANSATVNGSGSMSLWSGGTANDTTINANGFVHVSNGCTANRTTIHYRGAMSVEGGKVNGVTVDTSGSLYVYSGGTATGKMVFGSGAVFSMYDSAALDFDLTQAYAAPGAEEAIVNDLSIIQGRPVYTLTVSDTQADGAYRLADGATGFDKTITVKNTSGATLGTLTVGESVNINGSGYKLELDGGGVLTVSVGAAALTAPAKSDVDGNGISDVMFVWTGNDYMHGYWMNGTNEWRSAGSNHPAEWENLGCHDMTGDGKADSVLVGNVEIEGHKGAYIGYYADAIDAIDGSTWVNIDYLNNEGNVTWVNKIGNLTGGNANSIVWYAPDLFTLGAWTDGTSNWVMISGHFGGDAWNLVGCGDFDGDGKDSVVMSGAGGTYYYMADLDGTETSMGSSNWSGWTVRAIGDFKGDGRDDLVMFHEGTGSMVMLADGNLDDFKSIGQLDAQDWFVVGAGDYNADAKDDLLVRQYSTGMLGYYSSGDTSQWVELGRGVDMNWTVIA